MSVKFKRASSQYLSAQNGPNNSFADAAWSVCFLLDLTGATYTGSEPQSIFSTAGLSLGAINIFYLGSGHSTPNSLAVRVGSNATFRTIPANTLAGSTKWMVSIGRGSTGGMSARVSPVLASAPVDGGAVPTLTFTSALADGARVGTGAMVVGGQADLNASYFADVSVGRLFRVTGSILSTFEVARLAYGETVYDIGRTPDFYFPLETVSDLSDRGPNAAVFTANNGPTTGPNAGFGYVQTTPTAPVFSSPPAIIGTPTVGTPVNYTPGNVTGSPSPTVTRQWLINGSEIAGATSSTYTPVAGDAGKSLSIRETATNASGTVNSTSSGAAVNAASAFNDSFTAMTSRRIYQRIGTSAKVAMAGSYNVAPTSIEAQLVASADGTTVLQAWTPLIDLVVNQNAWAGNLAANQGGGYRAQVRFKDASGTVTYTSGLDANSWGVGELIVGAGSSTIHGWWTSGTYPGTTYVATYRTTDGYTWKAFPSVSNGIAKKIANDLAIRLGVPVGMVGAGESGTTLKSWTDANSSYFAKLTSAINAQGGKIGALMISMGSNDAANNIVTSRASHAAMLRKFIADVRTLTGQPNLKVLISGFNRRTDTNNTQADRVRMAEIDVGKDANVYHFPTVDMALSGDGIHLTDYNESGNRVVGIFNPILAGDNTYRRGPEISSITASGNKFNVKLTHRNGTDFTPSSSNSGFTASDDTGALTLTAARVSPTEIELTANRAIGNNPKVSYMSGANPNISAFTFDNGLLSLPMDVDVDRAVTFATPEDPNEEPPITGQIDASKVPNDRRVVFEGSKRVVSFHGSIHKVRF